MIPRTKKPELLTFHDACEEESWCFREFLFFVGLGWKISEAALAQKHRLLPLHIFKSTEGSNDQISHGSCPRLPGFKLPTMISLWIVQIITSMLHFHGEAHCPHFTFASKINGQPKVCWEGTTEWREKWIPWESHCRILVRRDSHCKFRRGASQPALSTS